MSHALKEQKRIEMKENMEHENHMQNEQRPTVTFNNIDYSDQATSNTINTNDNNKSFLPSISAALGSRGDGGLSVMSGRDDDYDVDDRDEHSTHRNGNDRSQFPRFMDGAAIGISKSNQETAIVDNIESMQILIGKNLIQKIITIIILVLYPP